MLALVVATTTYSEGSTEMPTHPPPLPLPVGQRPRGCSEAVPAQLILATAASQRDTLTVLQTYADPWSRDPVYRLRRVEAGPTHWSPRTFAYWRSLHRPAAILRGVRSSYNWDRAATYRAQRSDELIEAYHHTPESVKSMRSHRYDLPFQWLPADSVEVVPSDMTKSLEAWAERKEEQESVLQRVSEPEMGMLMASNPAAVAAAARLAAARAKQAVDLPPEARHPTPMPFLPSAAHASTAAPAPSPDAHGHGHGHPHPPSRPASLPYTPTPMRHVPRTPPPMPEKCLTWCSQRNDMPALCRMLCLRKREPLDTQSEALAKLRPSRHGDEQGAVASMFESLRAKLAPYSLVYVKGTADGVVGRYMEELDMDDGQYDFGPISRHAPPALRRKSTNHVEYLEWGEAGYLLHIPLTSLFGPVINLPQNMHRVVDPPLRLVNLYAASFTDGSQTRALSRFADEIKRGGAADMLGQMVAFRQRKFEEERRDADAAKDAAAAKGREKDVEGKGE